MLVLNPQSLALGALVLACASPFHCSRITRPAPQSECHQNLKSIFTHIRITPPREHEARGIQPTFNTFGVFLERGNRYAYFLGPGPLEDRSGADFVQAPGQMGIGVDTFKYVGHPALTFSDLPPEVARQVGLRVDTTAGAYDFVAACAGNIDNNVNDHPDIWTISSKDRRINGEYVEAGEPYNHVNDETTY